MDSVSFAKWVKSLERTSIVYEIDREVFYSKNDLVIIRDSLFIMDWEKEITIEIKQRETINVMKQLLDNLKYSGQRVDFNSKLENFNQK